MMIFLPIENVGRKIVTLLISSSFGNLKMFQSLVSSRTKKLLAKSISETPQFWNTTGSSLQCHADVVVCDFFPITEIRTSSYFRSYSNQRLSSCRLSLSPVVTKQSIYLCSLLINRQVFTVNSPLVFSVLVVESLKNSASLLKFALVEIGIGLTHSSLTSKMDKNANICAAHTCHCRKKSEESV